MLLTLNLSLLFQTFEKLAVLTEYLRSIHHYCIWCGSAFTGMNLLFIASRRPGFSLTIFFTLSLLDQLYSKCLDEEDLNTNCPGDTYGAHDE